jgi:hypothetical protein
MIYIAEIKTCYTQRERAAPYQKCGKTTLEELCINCTDDLFHICKELYDGEEDEDAFVANSIKNLLNETGASRVADKIIEVLENNGFQSDKDAARHILLMLVVGSYKISAVTRDLTNQSVGETIINEMYTSIKAHFGNYTTSEIMKHIFTAIAKYDMMCK